RGHQRDPVPSDAAGVLSGVVSMLLFNCFTTETRRRGDAENCDSARAKVKRKSGKGGKSGQEQPIEWSCLPCPLFPLFPPFLSSELLPSTGELLPSISSAPPRLCGSLLLTP